MTIHSPEAKGREPRLGGAGVIFYIRSTDQFMFFLRDDKDTIPYPNMIDIIGGHMEPEETPEEAALREVAEELEDADTGDPWRPARIALFKQYVDHRQVEQNIFSCELDTVPNIRTNEGQGLVFLSREQLAVTDFAYNYRDVVLEYAGTIK